MKNFRVELKLISVILVLSVVFSIAVLPASAAGNAADLTVTGVTSIENEMYDGDKITLTATVRNLSNVDVTEKFSVDFAIDGQFLQTVTYKNGIKSGKVVSVSTTFTYFLFGGSHRVTAYVNGSRKIAESNYANNILKERIDATMDANPNPPTLLPVEDEPVAMPKTYTYQAEKCTLLSGTTVSTDSKGYNGTGYVVIDSANDGFYLDFNAPKDGKYYIDIRYSTIKVDKGGISYARNENGGYIPIVFDKQDRNDSWVTKSVSTTLKKGENRIKYFVANNDKMNLIIDQLTVREIADKKVDSFEFLKVNNPSLTSDIKCDINNGAITAYIPSGLDVTDLVATYSTSCTSVKVQGAEQKSGVTHNDFTNGHYYTFTDKDGNSMTYTVKFVRLTSTGVPNMFVNFGSDVTSSEINTLLNGWQNSDKELKVKCTFDLVTDGKTVIPYSKSEELGELDGVDATINLRGNSTLGSPKKSYKVKFEKKQQVLDMEKSKSWVLLACYGDKSMLRDYCGYLLAQNFDKMGYAPDMRYVNLFVDGRYKGLYLFGEGAKIGNGRLEMTEINSASTNITGGYILELDSRRDEAENVMFQLKMGSRDYPFTIKEPDEDVVTKEMRDYISGYVQDFFDALYKDPTSHEYEKYIDVDSFVDWYIVMEIVKVNDSSGYSSIYLHKDADGKLCMGPVWDFVPGSGLVDYNGALDSDGNIKIGSVADSKGYWIKGSIWWKYLFKDPKFVEKVKARWQELYATDFDGILGKIDTTEQYIKYSLDDNFKRWDVLNKYLWAEPFVLHSRDAYYRQYHDWMEARIEWLNGEYGK